MPPRQRTSVLAVLSIVLAAVSFFTAPVLGFFMALSAVLLGVFGFLSASLSPRTKGGLMSILAILLGAVAMAVKIVEGALRLMF